MKCYAHDAAGQEPSDHAAAAAKALADKATYDKVTGTFFVCNRCMRAWLCSSCVVVPKRSLLRHEYIEGRLDCRDNASVQIAQ